MGPAAGKSVAEWLGPAAKPVGPAAGKSVAEWLNSTPTSGKATGEHIAKGVVSSFRDFGDMFLGAPASAVKAAVESAVDAYKHDPKAGVKAGEALANNPYFAPWLHPLASAQEGLTGKPADASPYSKVLDDLFGHATKAAEKAGEKAGVDKDTTRIVVDDVMSALGLMGLKGGVDLAGRIGTGTAKVPEAPREPVPIAEPKAAEPKPLTSALEPHIQASLRGQAQDILDGKVPQERAEKLMRRHPALVDALKETVARRNDARTAFTEMPSEPPLQDVVKGRLTDGLLIGKESLPDERPLALPNAPSTLDSAIAKVKEGRRFAMSPEERIAWNKAHQTGQSNIALGEWYRSKRMTGSADPELLAKLAGTAVKGVVMGLGRLMQEEPYTSKVLERLPQDKGTFKVEQLRQEVNRADITGPEKDTFNAIANLYGKDGRISASDLVKGFRLATEQYHLTPEETSRFASVGLTNIGRDLGSGETTTKYNLPFDVPQTNHFEDNPRLFGWTRSFMENGQRHVVELQSDLAQKGQVELPEEVRGAYRNRLQRYAESLPKYEEAERTGEDPHSANIARGIIADLKRKLAEPVRDFKTLTANWQRRLVQEELARAGGRPVRFATPDTVAKVEHWGENRAVYDNYKRNVVPYLRQLGGKDVKDIYGNTWMEVPSGGKARMYGFAHPDLLKKLGLAAGGALLFNYADGNNTWTSYATGAALALGGVWAAPYIRDGLKRDLRLRIDKYADSFEAATNLANIKVHILANNMEKALPAEADRIAVTRAREAGVKAATPEQAKVQEAAAAFFKQTGELAQQHGVLKELLDNYVTHLWDIPQNKGRFGSLLTTTSRFAKARRIPTLAEGKAMGLTPRTEDIAQIVRIYGESMNRAIQGKVFIEQLKGLQDPDGRPLVAQTDKAPKGYVGLDLPQLRGSLVHPDIAPSLRMFESPRLGAPFQALSEAMQAVKRIKVMGSLFHAKTLVEVGLTSRDLGKLPSLPRHLTNFALGRDSFLKQLNETGLGKDAEDLVRAGMNISQYRESPSVEDVGGSFYSGMKDLQSYLDAVSPTLAKGSRAFTEANHKLDTFTWGRLQTGMKMLVGTESMHRLEANGVPREEAAKIAANYVNTQFGGLNWRRIAEGARTRMGRDIAMTMLHPKARAVSQILLFAPDWTVSTIRQITQAARRSGGPLAQAKGLLKPTELADLHRLALLRSALYMFTLGNAVNYMLSGHMIWDNKDPLRIDLGDGRTMQFAKHITEPLEWVRQPAKTMAGKLSYTVTEPIDQLTGKEYIGGPPMQESRIQHAAEGFLPFSAGTTSPEAALAGMAGFPIYGHTEAERRLIALQRRERREERK